MSSYIISDKYEINVKEHEIKIFDILNKTKKNIFVIENNKVSYKNNIINNVCENGHIQVLEWFKYYEDAINYASVHGHIQVLEWFKNSGFEFKYYKIALKTKFIKILKFFSYYINIKKLIKWSDNKIFIKTIKFKTNNKYLKGYKKN